MMCLHPCIQRVNLLIGCFSANWGFPVIKHVCFPAILFWTQDNKNDAMDADARKYTLKIEANYLLVLLITHARTTCLKHLHAYGRHVQFPWQNCSPFVRLKIKRCEIYHIPVNGVEITSSGIFLANVTRAVTLTVTWLVAGLVPSRHESGKAMAVIQIRVFGEMFYIEH